MTSKSLALYLCLLDDLHPYLTSRSYEAVRVGKLDCFPGATLQEVACMQLANSFLKKFEDDSNSAADLAALEKFKSANLGCENWELKLTSLKEEFLFSAFKSRVWDFFHGRDHLASLVPDDLVSLLHASDLVGPGASLGASGQDFYTKLFSSKMSCTSSSLYLAYRIYVDGTNASWSEAENCRADHFGSYRVVSGNRLSFVPKNYDCSRVTCTEPLLNMMFQKGIGNILERRLKQYFGIDLVSQQAKNRELARLGSVTGDFVTIDLSSASDTIGLKMLERVLPKGVLSLLKLVRSPMTEVVNTGERLQLHMVSTMGNGYTFPLQTMLFACVVAACADVIGLPARDFVPPRGGNLGSYGVNGDDIVCRRELASNVILLLELLGFTVNVQKSFVDGPFRESCGGDYFYGHHVRGVYCKTLKEMAHRYSTINALNEWSARQGIPLRRTVQLLLRTVKWLPIPVWEDPAAGIRVPWSMVEGLRRCKNTKSVLYERLVFEPVRLKISDCEITVPSSVKERIYNPSGLLQAFLRGAVSGGGRNSSISGTIVIRHDRGWFRAKVGIAPNWESTPTVPLSGVPAMGQRWNDAVWFNLFREPKRLLE